MQTFSGSSNWQLTIHRQPAGIVILRARTCDSRAVLPESLFGLPVVRLGDKAFAPGAVSCIGEEIEITCGPAASSYDNQSLRDLTLPASLQQVGRYAFLNCSQLKVLRLPDSVRNWGSGAFMNCHSLDTVFLSSAGPLVGPSLSFLTMELARELDVTITSHGRFSARLVFPEYTEAYVENSPAHHFDLSITGGGYPYHALPRGDGFSFSAYDALWQRFLASEHEESAALRLAWRRLRSPAELSPAAEAAYMAFVRSHPDDVLSLAIHEKDDSGLSMLIKMDLSAVSLSKALELARSLQLTSLTAQLLQAQHLSPARGRNKTYDDL